MDTIMIGVEHWQIHVLKATGAQQPPRAVALTLQWVPTAGEFPPVTVAVAPGQAREIGEALVGYADQAGRAGSRGGADAGSSSQAAGPSGSANLARLLCGFDVAADKALVR